MEMIDNTSEYIRYQNDNKYVIPKKENLTNDEVLKHSFKKTGMSKLMLFYYVKIGSIKNDSTLLVGNLLMKSIIVDVTDSRTKVIMGEISSNPKFHSWAIFNGNENGNENGGENVIPNITNNIGVNYKYLLIN